MSEHSVVSFSRANEFVSKQPASEKPLVQGVKLRFDGVTCCLTMIHSINTTGLGFGEFAIIINDNRPNETQLRVIKQQRVAQNLPNLQNLEIVSLDCHFSPPMIRISNPDFLSMVLWCYP